MKYFTILIVLCFSFSLNVKAQYYDFNKDNFIVSIGYAASRIAEFTPYGSVYYHGTDFKAFYQINKEKFKYGFGLQHLLRGSRYTYQKMFNDEKAVKLNAYAVNSISTPVYVKKAIFKTILTKLTLAPTFIYRATGTGISDFEDTPDGFTVSSKNLLTTHSDHFGSTEPINQLNVYGSLALLKEIQIKEIEFEIGLEYAIDLFDTINVDRSYTLPYDKLHWFSLNVGIILD